MCIGINELFFSFFLFSLVVFFFGLYRFSLLQTTQNTFAAIGEKHKNLYAFLFIFYLFSLLPYDTLFLVVLRFSCSIGGFWFWL